MSTSPKNWRNGLVFKSLLLIWPTFILLACTSLIGASVSKESSLSVAPEVQQVLDGKLSVDQLQAPCEQGDPTSCFLLDPQKAAPVEGLRLSVSLSPRNGSVLLISVAHPSEHLQARLWVSASSRPLAPKHKETFRREGHDWFLSHFYFPDFQQQTTRVDFYSREGRIQDSRRIEPHSPLKKIALISCLSDKYEELQRKQWPVVFDQDPDALFLIGDNIYLRPRAQDKLKSITEALIWKRHMENRQRLMLYKSPTLVPTFVIWDDNDFGPNNADRRFPLAQQSAEIYRLFFPVPEDSARLQNGPGLSFSYSGAKNHFIFLDNRSFRHSIEPKSHFGSEQLTWLSEQMKSPNKLYWLISGGQFFGSHQPYESYSREFPEEFKTFLDQVRPFQTPRPVLLSGDRHLTEIQYEPTEKLLEVTSSGLHSSYYAGAMTKNLSPFLVKGHDGETNFVRIDIQENKLSFTAIGKYGRTLYKHISPIAP